MRKFNEANFKKMMTKDFIDSLSQIELVDLYAEAGFDELYPEIMTKKALANGLYSRAHSNDADLFTLREAFCALNIL